MQQRHNELTTITISAAKGSFKGMKSSRTWIVKLNKTFPPGSVQVSGKTYSYSEVPLPGTWTYSGDNLETILTLPPVSVRQDIVIKIMPMAGTAGREYLLEGHRGFVNRMKFAVERLKFGISAVDWGAAIPDLILNVESLPVRINYDPRKTVQFLLDNAENKKRLRNTVINIPDVKKEDLKNISDYLGL